MEAARVPDGDVVDRPRLADLAILLVLAAAAVNLAIAVLLVAQASTTELPVVGGLVAVVVAITVLYAAALVTLALLLRAGRPWARAVLAAVSALSLFTVFALNALNLAVIVLLLLAGVLLYRRPVTAWVRSLRGLSRA